MDVYDVSFFLSTMWVGPFWFAMLFYPEHAMTRKVMSGPIFLHRPNSHMVGLDGIRSAGSRRLWERTQ